MANQSKIRASPEPDDADLWSDLDFDFKPCRSQPYLSVQAVQDSLPRFGGPLQTVRADLGGHLKYSRRWSGVRAGVLLGAQGAVHRGENRGGL